jgi:hypothetical protein
MTIDEVCDKMITLHSGGYADILRFIRSIKGGAKKLDEIDANQPSGVVACRISSVLAKLGYSIYPGDKMWMQPCAFWEKVKVPKAPAKPITVSDWGDDDPDRE